MLEGVIVQHSIHIARPIEAVSAALAAAPTGWLPSLVGAPPSEGGKPFAGLGIRKEVTIQLGEPETSGLWTEVPITWQASYIKKLFPLMTGKINIVPVAGRATTLTVCGSYDPPPRRIVEHMDEVLVYKVAEAIVKELAESVAERLDAAAASY